MGYFGLVKEFSGRQPRGHQDSQQFLSNLDTRDEGSEDDEFFAFEKYNHLHDFWGEEGRDADVRIRD